jgi:hypothetical protein
MNNLLHFLILLSFLMHSWADWDIAMSTRAFKYGIISANIFNRGYSTFLSNLIMSASI